MGEIAHIILGILAVPCPMGCWLVHRRENGTGQYRFSSELLQEERLEPEDPAQLRPFDTPG